MCARQIAVLLPPSKGKADDDPAISSVPYARTLTNTDPLAGPRRVVLDALLSSPTTLSREAKMRLYGVGEAGLLAADQQQAALDVAPTRPARERYRGVVYTNAGLGDRTVDHPKVTIFIVSAVLGLVELDTPVPNYRVEFGAKLPPIGSLSRFWAAACRNYLLERLAGVEVWNLLPNEHRSILDGCADQLDVIDVRFVTPSGARANTARSKVAKGHIVATLRREGPLSAKTFAALDPLAPDWTFHAVGKTLTGVCHL
ncbi:MAG: peroxide stress protein YaaA [Nitriliruptoraceae bacterium]